MIKSAWKGRTDMVVYLFNFNTCQDLALLEIGDQQCSPLYAFGPNIRNEYIFHYVVSGKGVVMLQPSGEKGQNILSETIEVKAGENTRSRSLSSLKKTHPGVRPIRLSTKPFGMNDGLMSVPLYAAFCL